MFIGGGKEYAYMDHCEIVYRVTQDVKICHKMASQEYYKNAQPFPPRPKLELLGPFGEGLSNILACAHAH